MTTAERRTSRGSRALVAGLLMAVLAVGCGAPQVAAEAAQRAELWRVGGSGTLTVTLPTTLAAGQPIHIRTPGGAWRPLTPVHRDKAIVVTLTPDLLAKGSCHLLLSTPKGIVLDDATAPEISKPVFDADRVEGRPDVFRAIRKVTWQVADGQNPLDAESVRVELDGRPLAAEVTAMAGGRKLTVSAAPGDVPKGKRRISIRVADMAVVPNRASTESQFTRLLDTPDQALEALGTKIRVDSRFEGYDHPEFLIDGDTEIKPGTTHAFTWASAESAEPHWVELTFAKPVRVAHVYIYWSGYQATVHTSRAYQIQRKQGKGWKTVLSVKDQKPRDPSVHRVEPFETTALRIWQPAGGGCERRPNLMWVREIEVMGK